MFSFSDGRHFREIWLWEDSVFEDFGNTWQITERLKQLPCSENTVKDRAENLTNLVNLNEDKDVCFSFVWLRHLMLYRDRNCSYSEMAFGWHNGGTVSEGGLRRPRAKVRLKRLFSCLWGLILRKMKFRQFKGFCVQYIWIKLRICCTFTKTNAMQLCPHVVRYVSKHAGCNTGTKQYINRGEQ